MTFRALGQPKPVILTDSDGVLLNWFSRLEDYFTSCGMDTSHLPDVIKGNQYLPIPSVFPAASEADSWDIFYSYQACQHIEFLDVMENGSAHTLSKLSEHFDFIVVTNIGNLPFHKERRRKNLERHYGPIFKDIFCQTPNASKTEIIREIAKAREIALWIDDCAHHVIEGIKAGVPGAQYTFNMQCGRNTGEVAEFNSWISVAQHLDKKYGLSMFENAT